MVQKRLHVLAGLTRHKSNWRIAHLGKILSQISYPPIGWHLIFQQIPLVDDEDARLVFLADVIGELVANGTFSGEALRIALREDLELDPDSPEIMELLRMLGEIGILPE